ncbi:MAG: GTP cyclohydrolase I FolE [Spirochaetota bacterium]|nr:GTP cyclohydrolase I FolE [Spirochaetota bacterium]
MDKERIEKAVIEILKAIGEDPDRPGLKRTPERIASMYEEILSGHKSDAERVLKGTHELEHEEMVIIKDIPFYSMCEHHMLPFLGMCNIAYIPDNNRIIGISKLARVVDILSKRLQVQERLTNEIVETIMNSLKPKGVAVVIKARHLCMEMRGIKKSNTYIITSAIRGIFMKDIKTREEFLKLIE